jgi:hypothetical protein
VVRPFLEWQESGTVLPEAMREGDLPHILEMVERHEGPESADVASHWLERQPQGVLVFRDTEQIPSGFMLPVALDRATEDDFAVDQAAKAAAHYLRLNAPLRQGETSVLFRYWMSRDTYQDVSPIQSLIFINAVRYYFMPGMVFTFFPCANAEFWAPLFAYADLQRLPEVDFTVSDRRYGVFGHNWRATPPMAWLALLAEREIAAASVAAPAAPSSAPVVVLSQPDFAAAMHEALRNLTRPDALLRNPLLQSKLVMERAGANSPPAKRVAALQSLVKEACELIQQSPREAKLYRALYHTYLHAAPTQEQAAELLDLPFSTFRRHLKEGMTRLVEILWQWELQGISL